MKRRSAITIMRKLIVLVKPLLPIMLLAILLGTIGYLCAISITVLASIIVTKILTQQAIQTWIYIMLFAAILRGFLHYAEQYCNHFIAFKLLAIIRHHVFAQLRKLSPAKLDGKDSGNLISIITSDIELLEVFYAHTISPIAIAFCTSLILIIFLSTYHISIGIFACIAYLTIGILIPIYNGKHNGNDGLKYRNAFGELNSFVLDSLRSLEECIQYGYGATRNKQMQQKSDTLAMYQEKLATQEGKQRAYTNFAIQAFSIGMLLLTVYLYTQQIIAQQSVIICTITMMSSFGPVVALSSLSNNLAFTLASGERVLNLLDETAQIEEVPGNQTIDFSSIQANHINFAYQDETILKDFFATFEAGKIYGIHGPSGCGKSTLLKLFMRFYDVQSGAVNINSKNIQTYPTHAIRQLESYVTQSTYLFHDTIANNVAIAKQDATREEIIEACKKASIHEFITSLKDGYETMVGELGDTLSQGEKQRLGIARAFLKKSDLILLDEPTSNLDILNEGIILRSLKEETNATIILVSHRDSTMQICDEVIEMLTDRVS